MRLSVALPQDLSAGGPGLLSDHARRAEELGFDGLWTLDSGVGGPTARRPAIDPLPALAAAAAVTSTIPLGVAVVVASRRNPVQLAKDAASLDVLSGGRFVLGLGVGNDPPDAAALGFEVDHRGARLSDTVALLRALWGPDDVSFDGRWHSFSGVPANPKPAGGSLPVWLGGGSAPALERTARIADGWLAAGSTPLARYAEQDAALVAALETAGRDPAAFPRVRRVYLDVAGSREAALARLTPALDGMYGREGMTTACGVAGTPADVAEALAGLAADGATELLLNPLVDETDQLERLVEVRTLLA